MHALVDCREESVGTMEGRRPSSAQRQSPDEGVRGSTSCNRRRLRSHELTAAVR
jgi:hypothetical protein